MVQRRETTQRQDISYLATIARRIRRHFAERLRRASAQSERNQTGQSTAELERERLRRRTWNPRLRSAERGRDFCFGFGACFFTWILNGVFPFPFRSRYTCIGTAPCQLT